jgi:NIPSNAP
VKMTLKAAQSILDRWRFKGWILLGTALFSFAAGSLFTARLAHLREVRADSNRVFELMIYHTVPGKMPALESIFHDVAQLQTKYNLNVVGYWVPNEDPEWKNRFVYLVVHPSREAAEANWRGLHADPEFLPYRKSAEPLIEKIHGDYNVDDVYMRPTDFSAMK